MGVHCRETKSVWVPFKETMSLPLSTPAITKLRGISPKSSSAFAVYFFLDCQPFALLLSSKAVSSSLLGSACFSQ